MPPRPTPAGKPAAGDAEPLELTDDEVTKLRGLLEGGGGSTPDPDRRYTRAEMEDFAAQQTAEAQKALKGTPAPVAPADGAAKGDAASDTQGSTGAAPPSGATSGDRRKAERRTAPPPAAPAKQESSPAGLGRLYRALFGNRPE